jgi:hypothetical protein
MKPDVQIVDANRTPFQVELQEDGLCLHRLKGLILIDPIGSFATDDPTLRAALNEADARAIINWALRRGTW